MTQRVTDEQLVRWTRSNDSALNDVSADCQDARAEIATLRAKLAAVCEAVSEYIAATDAANAAALANDAIGPHWAKRNAAYDALAALAAAREGEE